MMDFGTAVLVSSIGGLICTVIGGSKKYNPFFFMLLGMLLPVIGVVIALFVKPVKEAPLRS